MSEKEQLNSAREEATKNSRDCPFCHCNGMVTVYHPTFTGDSVAVTKDGRRYPTSVTAHCRCELGIWIRNSTPIELQARIPWVEDICSGRSQWLLERPNFDADCHEWFPGTDPDAPVTAESFRKFWDRIRHGQVVKHIPPSPTKTTAAKIERALHERALQRMQEEIDGASES